MSESSAGTLMPYGAMASNPVRSSRLLLKTSRQNRISVFDELGIKPDKTITLAIRAQATADGVVAEFRKANEALLAYSYNREMREFAATDRPASEAPVDKLPSLQASVRALDARRVTARQIAESAVEAAYPAIVERAQRVAADIDKQIDKEVGKVLKQVDKISVDALERAIRTRAWSQQPTASLSTARGADINKASEALATLRAVIEGLVR